MCRSALILRAASNETFLSVVYVYVKHFNGTAMTAQLFMDPNPLVLHPTDTIGTAAGYIMTHRYRSLPVVDEEGRYLGVFGINCLLHLCLPKAVTVEQGLTSVPYVMDTLEDLRSHLREVIANPITKCLDKTVAVVHPDTPTTETLLTLYRTRLSLPVVEKETGRLVGMISYFNVGAAIMGKGN